MNRAYIVCGPESSGNHVFSMIFQTAGCTGDWGVTNEFRTERFALVDRIKGLKPPIIIRRSVPHGEAHMLNFKWINDVLRESGFESWWIIPVREWKANCNSMVKNQHEGNFELASEAYKRDYIHIFRQMVTIERPFYLASTSLLFVYPERVMKSLGKWCGIKFPIDKLKPRIKDPDAGWLK